MTPTFKSEIIYTKVTFRVFLKTSDIFEQDHIYIYDQFQAIGYISLPLLVKKL